MRWGGIEQGARESRKKEILGWVAQLQSAGSSLKKSTRHVPQKKIGQILDEKSEIAIS